jgi:hypothetical protein
MNRQQRRAARHKKFGACKADHPGPYRMATELESDEITRDILEAILAEFQDPIRRELETRTMCVLALRAVALAIKSGGENPIDYFATFLATMATSAEVDAALDGAYGRIMARQRVND